MNEKSKKLKKENISYKLSGHTNTFMCVSTDHLEKENLFSSNSTVTHRSRPRLFCVIETKIFVWSVRSPRRKFFAVFERYLSSQPAQNLFHFSSWHNSLAKRTKQFEWNSFIRREKKFFSRDLNKISFPTDILALIKLDQFDSSIC